MDIGVKMPPMSANVKAVMPCVPILSGKRGSKIITKNCAYVSVLECLDSATQWGFLSKVIATQHATTYKHCTC